MYYLNFKHINVNTQPIGNEVITPPIAKLQHFDKR